MSAAELRRWLKAARKGDDEAFRRLVEATRESLYRTVRRMVGRDAIAEEILQEGYLSLWSGAGGSEPQNPEAWLRRLVVNRTLDHLRREESRRPHVPLDDLPLAASPAGSPLESLGGREAEEILRLGLAGMPPRMRIAFVLRTEGHEYPEIAAMTGVSESTVRNQVLQARRRLACLFRERGSGHD